MISHTANGILTNLTGMYSDRHGQAVSNSYREDQIASLTSARDALASQIRGALDAAAFDGHPINEHQAQDWIARAQLLLNQSAALAAVT